MHAVMRMLCVAAAALLPGLAAAQSAETPAVPKGPPAGFVAPAEPKPGETNAERAKTQPGNNAPFWTAVRQSGEQAGYVSLPGAEKGVLIQQFVRYPGSSFTTAGEAWREVRNRWIIPYGGALLLIVLAAVGLFYWRRGPIGHDEAGAPKVIERFTYFERAAHGVNAVAFTILAVSGIVMAFGKFFLLPVIGGTLFGWLTYALKNLHNFAGPVFAVSLVVVIVAFVRDNFPRAGDLGWLLRAGGMFGKQEIPSHRFNAGEKIMFWVGAFVLGLVVVGSGLVLDQVLPGVNYVRGNMQIAHMIHAAAAVLMMALFVGHIYLGTVGVRGAFDAMRSGYVSDAWAREHHALWAEDIRAGKIPAKRTRGAEPPPQPAVQS